MNKEDSWIRTYTGGKVYFFEPEKSNIEIEDIAHALSLCCRFNGATREFYSVAQHSVFVADWIYQETKDSSLAYQGLMHDAAEAFITDVPSPFKKYFDGFIECEQRMESWLAKRFKFQYPFDPIVKKYDLIALSTEMRDLMNFCDNDMVDSQPHKSIISPTSHGESKKKFMELYRTLQILRS